ncbi:amino acid ABC transporter permease [Streptacidiphilus jiangxiensis]|uniref:Polar amino acid transport system permease protein n=1 Tax=Streptacidiphilus jiangxiensis TaxID=235985 RepID=A0A1H7TG61_STRJI|nr:amino acid ABC transporter permease [Streptacidiphilus jiangxiensis]SEL82797.1 polar amino acid transport system permease protein [Streptacidiphilus jiangxiensis]
MSESLVPVVPSGTTHPPEADLPPQSAPPTSTGQRADQGPAAGPLSAQRVIPLRHPGRWITSAVALVLVAQIVHGLATNPFYQWDRFQYWFARPVITDGLWITLEVTAYSAVLGLLGGVVLALARLSRSPVLRAISWVYVWLFRSVPLIVVLLFLYNFSALYRTLSLGVPFGPAFWHFDESKLATDMVIAVIGLSLNEAAYAAEVVRAGILSVDQGQHEAAAALGLPKRYQFTRIVFPQALRAIVPSYVNQLIGLVKGTSLVFYVSLLDLFGSVQSMGSTYPGDIVPLLLVATVWYVILTSVISVVQFYVERYYSRGALRTLPPTPLQRLRAGLPNLIARVRRETAS